WRQRAAFIIERAVPPSSPVRNERRTSPGWLDGYDPTSCLANAHRGSRWGANVVAAFKMHAPRISGPIVCFSGLSGARDARRHRGREPLRAIVDVPSPRAQRFIHVRHVLRYSPIDDPGEVAVEEAVLLPYVLQQLKAKIRRRHASLVPPQESAIMTRPRKRVGEKRLERGEVAKALRVRTSDSRGCGHRSCE